MVEKFRVKLHHRDTEDTEVAQRNPRTMTPRDKPLLLDSCRKCALDPYTFLVLVREATANAFFCFVRKTSARDEVRWFIRFGASGFADDMQVFQVPLAPRANP